MILYEIALPRFSNDGQVYFAALQAWETVALDVAGGFTRRPDGDGHWRDAGKVYAEPMVPYRVACRPDQFRKLLAAAFELFPDQLAIFHAQIGIAEITTREEFVK